MTLQERLEEIAREMASKGAKRTEILLYQLYLICIAKEKYLGKNPKDTRCHAPFDKVESILVEHGVDLTGIDSVFKDEDLENRHLGEGFYQQVFSELLNSAARNSGKDTFDHLQPKELTTIIAALCGDTEGKNIYNPYAGVGSYAEIFHAGDCYHGEEFDSMTWAIGVLKAWLEGNLSTNYICGNSLSPVWKTRFDIVVSTPPIGRISNSLDTYCERLATSAPQLLKPHGTLVMVTFMSNLYGPRKRALLNTGMLDMVITLPKSVFYWSPIAPVVIRLRNGRSPEEPVTLVEGSSFFSPGGRNTRIINNKDLLRAIDDKDPAFTLTRSTDDLLSNEYGLNPSLYFTDRQADGEGDKHMVPLRDLGSFPKLRRFEADDSGSNAPALAITVGDLTSDPSLADMEPHPLENEIRGFKELTQPALLMFAIPGKIRVGYAHATPDKPIYIQDRIHAFVPDETLVSIRYLAHELVKAEIVSSGASIIILTRDDLLLTRIPIVPKDEQEALVRKELKVLTSSGHKVVTPPPSAKRPTVVFVSSQSPAHFLNNYLKLRTFETPSGAEAWVTRNLKKVDAVIVNYSDGMDFFSIVGLCKTDIPIFFLTTDPRNLENLFGNNSEYLEGHSFVLGSEMDLVGRLVQETAERKTPEWLIRQRYARELEAAESIDNKFPSKDGSLASFIEEILLSDEANPDWWNRLRRIRDEYLLTHLIDYGFLPPVLKGDFNLGALLDFMVNRCYTLNDRRLILIREFFPAEVAEMLRGSRHLLNGGSHSTKNVGRALMLSALFSIMAGLCHLSEMIDKGLFDKKEPDQVRSQFLATIRNDERETGLKLVSCLQRDDNSEYFYADNIHLDGKLCQSLCLKKGDMVNVLNVGIEKLPLITDSVQVLFYSNDFRKVNN